MSEVKCKDCVFFDASFPKQEGEGMCRANPPLPLNRHMAIFPIVKVNGWCGCFEPKEDDA